MRTVTIALIGCGTVTIKAHIPALMNDPSARLSGYCFRITAVCSLEQDNMDLIRAMLPGVETFTDYRELLVKSECEAVLIATGEESHPQICRAALECGKYVLCEKPLGISRAEIAQGFQDVKELAETKLQVGFNKRYYPCYLRYKDLLESGGIGRPISGSFYFITQQGRKTGWPGILSNLIHYCDLIVSIFGELQDPKVCFNVDACGTSISVAALSIDQAVVSLFFSTAGVWQASLHEEWQILDGNRTRLLARNGDQTYLFRNGSEAVFTGMSNSVFWLADPHGYVAQLKAFYDLVCGAIPRPEVGYSDAIAAHALFDRIQSLCSRSLEG